MSSHQDLDIDADEDGTSGMISGLISDGLSPRKNESNSKQEEKSAYPPS